MNTTVKKTTLHITSAVLLYKLDRIVPRRLAVSPTAKRVGLATALAIGWEYAMPWIEKKVGLTETD